MADPKSRARVSRLLSPVFHRDDLVGLFLFARDHCDGRESVVDIGDFVAHHNERDRGLITRSTREWFATVRFHMPRFAPGGPYPIDLQSLPSSAKEYLQFAAKRIQPKTYRSKTRFNQSEAHKLAVGLSDRLIRNPNGTFATPRIMSNAEYKVMEFLCSVMPVQPAFQAERIVDDFIATLKSNNLITSKEIQLKLEYLSSIIRLFTVSVMHNCVIDIGDGTKSKLTAGASAGKISVYAHVKNAIPQRPQIEFKSSIFESGLDSSVYCTAEMQHSENWDYEIEVTPDKILAPFR